MTSDALSTVAVYELRHQAEIDRAVLDAAGIAAMVVADDEGGLNPGFFATYGVRLVVRADHLDEARVVLDIEPGQRPA